MIEPADIIRVAATFAATWLAIRVELRWLRSDVNRAHTKLDKHDERINKLEQSKWRGR